ncbi:AtpZ/AtpI family protein [Kribbella sp. NPDC054772]
MSEHQDPKPSPGGGDGWRVLSYLIGGVAVYGGIGFLLDRLFGTQFLVLVGIVIGAGLTILLLHFRYGSRS